MKLFLTILATLAAAVGLAMLAIEDPGYVVVARDPYTVRMPLLLFVMLVLVGFVLLYLLINFLVGLVRAPKRYRAWREHSQETSAQKLTMQGYAGLIEGDWGKAEAALLKKLEYNRAPLLNYLGAAYAAQQQGETARRDQYLDQALAQHDKQQVAINLTRARLQYHAGEIDGARTTLENIVAARPRSAPAVRLLADVYTELGDWQALTALLPTLKKSRALSDEDFAAREALAYDNLMASPALTQGEGNQVQKTWKSLPAERRRNPATVAMYVRQLLAGGDTESAESVLRSALKKQLDEDLLALYSRIDSQAPEQQLRFVEGLLRDNPDNAQVMLALARAHHRGNDLLEAKKYYEQAIDAGAGEGAFFGLATLLERAGKLDSALYFLKKGIGEELALSPGDGVPALSGEVVESERKGAPQQAAGDDPEAIPVVK